MAEEKAQSYTPTGFDIPTKSVKVSGVDYEAPLTPEERELQRRLFASVATLPEEFKAWLPQHQAVNGLPIPQSQVTGLSSFSVAADKIPASGNAQETTTTSAYGDLATVGPSLQVGAGRYVLIYGCNTEIQGAGTFAAMSISVNGATATDLEAVSHTGAVGSGSSVARAFVTVLTEASNTIVAKYGSNGGGFRQRFLVAIRYGSP